MVHSTFEPAAGSEQRWERRSDEDVADGSATWVTLTATASFISVDDGGSSVAWSSYEANGSGGVCIDLSVLKCVEKATVVSTFTVAEIGSELPCEVGI